MPLDAIHDFNRQLLTDLPHQRFEHEPALLLKSGNYLSSR